MWAWFASGLRTLPCTTVTCTPHRPLSTLLGPLSAILYRTVPGLTALRCACLCRYTAHALCTLSTRLDSAANARHTGSVNAPVSAPTTGKIMAPIAEGREVHMWPFRKRAKAEDPYGPGLTRPASLPSYTPSEGNRSSFPTIYGERRRMTRIPGSPPDLRNLPPGCSFHPPCPLA